LTGDGQIAVSKVKKSDSGMWAKAVLRLGEMFCFVLVGSFVLPNARVGVGGMQMEMFGY
jgi:hypothetical protein